MARRGTQRNELILSDPVSGSEIAFYYAIPTTRDHVDVAKYDGEKASEEAIDNFIDKALEKVVGIRDGDFEREAASGAWAPISSDPESPDYYPGWKQFLREYAPDLLLSLGRHLFRLQAYAVRRKDTEGK